MQVIHIVPGSGGTFYCGNCLRDSTYIGALRKSGLDVVKIPMYLPLFADEHDLADIPVFYGAISLYLKHVIPFLRKAPSWFDRILNSGPALKLAARMSGSTDAKGLEDMTISMLLGEQGEQKKELDHLVDWITEHSKPDVVHLSNALLLGLARKIKEKLDVKVVCTLQDEDIWVNAMDEPFKIKTWELMQERAKDVDAFFAVSKFFGDKMKKQLAIPDNKLYTTYISVNPEDYSYKNSSEKPFSIGYISRMNTCNGLEVLIDAFIRLKKEPGFENLQLVLTGGSTSEDTGFIKGIKRKIEKAGLLQDVDFHKDFEEEGRHAFFEKISVISVPVLQGEAFGMYLIESMAAGIPVIQPNLGAFKEIVDLSGGGVIYEPNKAEVLAKELGELIRDPDRLSKLSEAGRKGVEKHFDIHNQADKIMGIYQKMINSGD
ncbi:glycosyltransferase family 4 protein [Bacteroidota bacterium]